ncbi:MAG: enoyl-CoA hydratase/isomerase family protein [Myxococcota bacterium]|jgi:enoyl-CoA hydratase/carnithine racemase|nr:enoyl-CoA hydratase/isomerase family protein [Myxococcota bacterium]
MKYIELEKRGEVVIATLRRGKANALCAALVLELLELVELLGRDESCRVLLLASGCEKVFCAGFDVKENLGFGFEAMHRFITDFVNAIEGLRNLPQVVVVEISGHAYAGGALLALAGDLRVMADVPLHFAIPEADLGVNMPLELTGWLAPIPHGVLREMLLCAAPLSPPRALEIGLVSRVVGAAELRRESLALCETLSAKAPLASVGIKAGLNRLAGGLMDAGQRTQFVDKFVESWFEPESVERRRRLVGALGKTSIL